MFKIATIVSLMLIATWSEGSRRQKREAMPSGDLDPGSAMWASGLSCDSCGSECASACGTRHFRSCCFNYLRKKRGPDHVEVVPTSKQHAVSTGEFPRVEAQKRTKIPLFIIENVPDPWTKMLSSEFQSYAIDDTPENRIQLMYDA